MVDTKITIPCHWDRKVIDEITSYPVENNIAVGEVYGVLAKGGPVGHGRSSNAVVQISHEDAIDFREYISDKGLTFSYLLNAPFQMKDNPNLRHDLDKYLNWVLGEMKPDAVTIASLELMREVREKDKNVGIHISTIAGVKNARDLEPYLEVQPNRVVPHHDVGKNWDDLREIVNLGEKHGVEVEMLATESCLYRCPQREAHYQHLAGQGEKDAPFHTVCNTEKLTRPRQFLHAGGMIRPEDSKIYEDMGVKHIKISGRSKPPEWLPEVAKAYTDRSYDGNLVRLWGIDPSMKAEDWIHINNKSLDGFIQHFPQGEGYREQAEYCDQWISKLHEEGDFYLRDETQYKVEGKRLRIVQEGVNSQPIISKERGG